MTNAKKKLLICLLGGQTMPNVIAAARQGPEVVWAVCSAESQSLFENLRHSLSYLPSPPTEVKLVRVPPYDFDAIKSIIGKLLSPQCLEAHDIVIDVTGGTKVMSLGLCHTAWQRRLTACQYIVSERGTVLEKLGMPTTRCVALDSSIPIAAYLGACGFKGRPNGQPEIPGEVFSFLLKDIERTWRCMNDLRENNAMQRFPGSGGRLPYKLASSEAKAFFADLAPCGWGRIEGGMLHLNSFEQDCLWGDWVEYYAARELGSLCKQAILDEAWGSTGIFNLQGRLWRELDALAIRHARLLVFSCKQTKAIHQKPFFDNLEGSRKDLGRYVSLFLLSVGRFTKPAEATAHKQGIVVIHSKFLPRLRDIVAREVLNSTVSL